jgi:hypothetical protein
MRGEGGTAGSAAVSAAPGGGIIKRSAAFAGKALIGALVGATSDELVRRPVVDRIGRPSSSGERLMTNVGTPSSGSTRISLWTPFALDETDTGTAPAGGSDSTGGSDSEGDDNGETGSASAAAGEPFKGS